MGTGSLPGVKYGRGMLLTTHPLLVLQSWKSRAIPLPNLWATPRPVMGTLYLLSSDVNKPLADPGVAGVGGGLEQMYTYLLTYSMEQGPS